MIRRLTLYNKKDITLIARSTRCSVFIYNNVRTNYIAITIPYLIAPVKNTYFTRYLIFAISVFVNKNFNIFLSYSFFWTIFQSCAS